MVASFCTATVVTGVKFAMVTLYKAILAVGAVAAVVKVPPAAVPLTVPTPTVGAAT